MIRFTLRSLVIACAAASVPELSSAQTPCEKRFGSDPAIQCLRIAIDPALLLNSPQRDNLKFYYYAKALQDEKAGVPSAWGARDAGLPEQKEFIRKLIQIYLALRDQITGREVRDANGTLVFNRGTIEGFRGEVEDAYIAAGITPNLYPASNQPQGARPMAEKAACVEYYARIQRFWTETAFPFEKENGFVYSDLRKARDLLQVTSRRIQRIKSLTRPGSLEEEEEIDEIRRKTYARIKELDAVVKQIEAHSSEIRRLVSEADAAGCSGLNTYTPRTGADKAIDELLELDSPKDPSPSPNPGEAIMGVAGATGQVEVQSQDGTRTPLTSGTRIGLTAPITIRTGPGSSVTIQVGSVRKTLQPNTAIRIVPKDYGQPDFIEQGAATVDVRKPGAYQIQTPTTTANVDGTVFTVSHDATNGVTGVMLEEGRVTVRPKNPGVRGVTLAPGEYVEVTRDAMTAVLPAPGAAETRGGVTSAGIDLTGLWQDDTGGGAIYRLRQVDNWLYWIVDGTPKGSYVNLSYGQISGNTITGLWVDLPGSPSLSSGNLTLRIESNDRLVKVGSSGYGAQAWIRVGTTGGRQ